MVTKWIQPTGFDTGLKIYNVVVNKKVPLIVYDKNSVNWYTCGPTVYSKPHLGHATTYVRFDIIQRILKSYFNLGVLSAMNITDVDDKIVNEAQLTNKSIREITEMSETYFWRDMEILSVQKPTHVLKVTENMHLIENMIEILLNNGYAYEDNKGSVNFNLKKMLPLYGKLRKNIPLEDVKDFALWKLVESGPSWLPKWGHKGRPGWHIECSALATHIFGNRIDIHAGGVDLQFPHHENEEIQCCAYFNNSQWVNYWIHSGHLNVKSTKMSKSLHNGISVEQMCEKNHRFPYLFRLALLMSHYRNDVNYTDKFMAAAESCWRTFEVFFLKYEQYLMQTNHFNEDSILNDFYKSSIQEIDNALKDDFNTSLVIKILHRLVNKVNDNTDSELSKLIYQQTVNILDMFGLSYRNLRNEQNAVYSMLFNEFHASVESYALGSNLSDLFTLCNEYKSRSLNIGDFTRVLNEFREEVRTYALRESRQDLLSISDSLRQKLREKYGIQTIDKHSKKRVVNC